MVGLHHYHRKGKHNFQPSLGVVGSSMSTMLGEGGKQKKKICARFYTQGRRLKSSASIQGEEMWCSILIPVRIQQPSVAGRDAGTGRLAATTSKPR